MNNINIKENRKKLGLTQSDLAEKIGVTLKTIQNYEKGETIPVSKLALLHNVLNQKDTHKVEEPPEVYSLNSGTYKKIEEVEEVIKEREKIISLSKDNSVIEHQKEIIKLLKVQIDLLKKSLQNKINE